jgi:hypothetical protein
MEKSTGSDNSMDGVMSLSMDDLRNFAKTTLCQERDQYSCLFKECEAVLACWTALLEVDFSCSSFYTGVILSYSQAFDIASHFEEEKGWEGRHPSNSVISSCSSPLEIQILL